MISTRGRYALRMMVDLARHQGEGFVALKDIARRQDISKKYLEQIIPVLNRAALLPLIKKWIKSKRVYTVRFAIGMLMRHFLDEDFAPEYLEMVAAVKSDEYYIKMER